MGLKRDGTIIGVRAKVIGDAGAYPAIGAFLPFLTRTMSPGRVRDPEGRVQLVERGHEHHADRGVPRRRPARGHRVARAHHRHGRRRARHRPGRDPQAQLHPARARSRSPPSPARTTTSASTRRRSTRRAASPATTSCAPSRRQRRERGDTKQLGIGVSRLRRGHRRRPVPGVRRGRGQPTTAPSPRRSAPRRTARATRPRSR